MKYEKKITLGRDKDGKLIRKSIYGNTKAELEKKVFRARQEWLEKASVVPKGEITFIAFVNRWYNTEKAHSSHYTQRYYRNIIDNHLKPDFDELYFEEITLADYQALINKNFQYPALCRQIVNTLKQIYNAADDEELLTAKAPNFKRIVLPPKTKSKTRALTDNEKDAIFSADFTDREKAIVYILYYTGVRREECLALEPSCFDFKNKTVTIRQTITYAKGGTILEQKAKNIYSLRTISLPDACVPFLKEYAQSCAKWLFPSPKDSNKLMCNGTFCLLWKSITKKMAVYAPEAVTLHPHLFRHNYATMLYYSNITPKMAAKLLGHADTTQILKTYAHLDEQKEMVAEKLNSVFTK